MAIPRDLELGMLPTSAGGNSFTAEIYPNNGSVWQISGGKITIDIPGGQPSQYLDPANSRLEFRIINKQTVGESYPFLDAGVWSIFSKFEIYHGSRLIESVDQLDQLYTIMLSAQMPMNQRQGYGAACLGIKVQPDENDTFENERFTSMYGTCIPGGEEYWGCYCLPSSLIGSLATKYLPIHALSADIRLELTLNDANSAFRIGTKGNDTTDLSQLYIDNIKFTMSICELDAGSDAAVMKHAESKGVVAWHASQFRSYVNSISAGSTYSSMMIPARFVSWKSVHGCIRPASHIGNNAVNTSATETANLTRMQVRMGSILIPSSTIYYDTAKRRSQQIINYTNEAWGVLPSHIGEEGIWLQNIDMFNNADLSELGAGAFQFGLNLTRFPGSTDELMNSGTNALTQNCFLELYLTAPHDLRVNTWAHYDCLYTIDDNGLMEVRY